MKKPVTEPGFEVLDEEHRQIHINLIDLQTLAQRLLHADPTEEDRKLAAKTEAFFSGTSRQHHAREEKNVFPDLLNSADEEMANIVRTLKQDHGFLEENWIVLGPQLRAVAEGNQWVDPAELLHNLDVFTDLCMSHIALEESLVYPQAKARLKSLLESRKAKSAAGA